MQIPGCWDALYAKAPSNSLAYAEMRIAWGTDSVRFDVNTVWLLLCITSGLLHDQ